MLDVKESAAGLDAFLARLREAGLDAPWAQPGPLIRPKASAVQTALWRWSAIEPLVREGPRFVVPERGAERRILRLHNPGVPERTATHTISLAVQYLLPGEVAPAHRHTPNAVRFMLEGDGAYTAVDGVKYAMRRGDVVLTPSMTWHDHGNEGTAPVMWLDGLDSPVVRYLENLWTEPYPHDRQPVGADTAGRTLHFPWAESHAALLRAAEGEPDPYDDVILEYVDPRTGRSLLPTLGCYLQLIRPGVRTRAHRQTSSAVYFVVGGAGATVVDGVRLDWREGDFFAIPPRARHDLASEGPDPAVLFSFQDVPLLTALGQYRAEP
jgi:gentisate 1,2-dioxygenase